MVSMIQQVVSFSYKSVLKQCFINARKAFGWWWYCDLNKTKNWSCCWPKALQNRRKDTIVFKGFPSGSTVIPTFVRSQCLHYNRDNFVYIYGFTSAQNVFVGIYYWLLLVTRCTYRLHYSVNLKISKVNIHLNCSLLRFSLYCPAWF